MSKVVWRKEVRTDRYNLPLYTPPAYNVYVADLDGVPVAEVVKTGESRDNYPWEYSLTPAGSDLLTERRGTIPWRSYSVTDTMKAAKRAVEEYFND